MLTSEAVKIHASIPQHMHTQDKLQNLHSKNLHLKINSDFPTVLLHYMGPDATHFFHHTSSLGNLFKETADPHNILMSLSIDCS